MMAARKLAGRFHPRCGVKVDLSNERRVACGTGVASCFAFSNDQIPIGIPFSVKILEQKSTVSPIGTSSIYLSRQMHPAR